MEDVDQDVLGVEVRQERVHLGGLARQIGHWQRDVVGLKQNKKFLAVLVDTKEIIPRLP